MNHHLVTFHIQNLALPCYAEIVDSVPDEYADQNMRFFIECSALGLHSIGGGVTKKMAKHTSAEKLLMQLKTGNGEADDNPSYSQSLEVNAITELHDYCTVRNFHRPDFKCTSFFGPTHDPSFTFECRLDSVVGTATAGTKQLAKQLSAKAVLDVVKQVSFPEIDKVTSNLNMLITFRAILTPRRSLCPLITRHRLILLVRRLLAIANLRSAIKSTQWELQLKIVTTSFEIKSRIL